LLSRFSFGILFLDNLPLADERGPLIPEINLIVQPIRLVADRLDDGIDDLAAVHADADLLADFGLFGGHGVSLVLRNRGLRICGPRLKRERPKR
jgi:hypothetical protein